MILSTAKATKQTMGEGQNMRVYLGSINCLKEKFPLVVFSANDMAVSFLEPAPSLNELAKSNGDRQVGLLSSLRIPKGRSLYQIVIRNLRMAEMA